MRDLDLLAMTSRSDADIAALDLLTRESMVKSGLYAYHDQKEATNKFYMAALILSDPVLETLRRELRRLSAIKLSVDELRALLMQDVIKRDLLDGDKADGARKKVQRAASSVLRAKREEGAEAENGAGTEGERGGEFEQSKRTSRVTAKSDPRAPHRATPTATNS